MLSPVRRAGLIRGPAHRKANPRRARQPQHPARYDHCPEDTHRDGVSRLPNPHKSKS